MTTAEQITQLDEHPGAEVAARMADLHGEERRRRARRCDEDDSKEFDGLETGSQEHRYAARAAPDAEQLQMATATPVTPTTQAIAAAEPRTRSHHRVKSNVPPGTGVHPPVPGDGRRHGLTDARPRESRAKQWKDTTPEVELMLKAAVAPAPRPMPRGRARSRP